MPQILNDQSPKNMYEFFFLTKIKNAKESKTSSTISLNELRTSAVATIYVFIYSYNNNMVNKQSNSQGSLKHTADDVSGPMSPISTPAQKQLKYSPGIANSHVRELAAYTDPKKMIPLGQLSMKKLAVAGQAGKLWRWKRSHHQWILQFKWKWQKPWRLSEWIKHCDETIVRTKPRPQALTDMI